MNNFQLKLASINSNISLKKVKNTYVLSIADYADIKKPIQIDLRLQDYKITRLNLHIIVGKNSKATIIEKFDSKSVNLHQEINADIGSNLRMISIQNLPVRRGGNSKSDFTENRILHAKKSAKIHCLDFQLGGKTSKLDIEQNADGESDINADILCNAKNNQQFNFNIKNIYRGKNGCGQILAKISASDNSFVSINGEIDIQKKAGGTDTYLKQDCLLLSKTANIKTSPKLKINTDNVKAGHGAGITNLNKESLFYLTSRGINEKNARKMMIEGFMKEIIDKIDDLPEVQEYIRAGAFL